jgi:hypothetical protein
MKFPKWWETISWIVWWTPIVAVIVLVIVALVFRKPQ